ncbi:MAG: helix-turn-helix domain-containing protein [Pseudomonadota bacterium]
MAGPPKKKISTGRTGVPNPIDIHVGARVRIRRSLLNMSQEKLAEMLGLTFQQVQKYERGINRISCSRLYDIAQVLSAPISFFFDDLSQEVKKESPRLRAGLAEYTPDSYEADPLQRRETLELMSYFYNIRSEEQRKLVFHLCKSLATGTPGRRPKDEDA